MSQWQSEMKSIRAATALSQQEYSAAVLFSISLPLGRYCFGRVRSFSVEERENSVYFDRKSRPVCAPRIHTLKKRASEPRVLHAPHLSRLLLFYPKLTTTSFACTIVAAQAACTNHFPLGNGK